MKALNLLVVVLVVVGVFGCAEQSSVTSPATDIAMAGQASPNTNLSGQWAVDRIVYVQGSRQNYLMNGSIDYVLAYTADGFTLTADVKLETLNLSSPKSSPVFVGETYTGHGEITKGNMVILTKEYEVENGLNLHLEFGVGEGVELRDVSLVVTPYLSSSR